jgi:hypothetical protein
VVNTYASYMKMNQIVTLNSMTAGFLRIYGIVRLPHSSIFNRYFWNR